MKTEKKILCVFIIGMVASMVSAAPIITSLTPDSGLEGTPVAIKGSDLLDTSRVLFHSFPSGINDDGVFNVVNDTLLDTAVPSGFPYNSSEDWLVSVFNDDGATLAFQDTVNIISGVSGGGGSSSFLVKDGGSLSGGFGSSVVFVESGGSYENSGGGLNLIFVESGGSYIGGGGGGNLLFFESGANITDASGEQLLDVNYVTIPEPASIGLLGLVFGGLYFSRRFFRI